MIHPVIDEYYNHSPSYTRSSGFAVSKGLVSNAPGATQTAGTPAKDEGVGVEGEVGCSAKGVDGVELSE